jgi:hypothetical protein
MCFTPGRVHASLLLVGLVSSGARWEIPDVVVFLYAVEPVTGCEGAWDTFGVCQ